MHISEWSIPSLDRAVGVPLADPVSARSVRNAPLRTKVLLQSRTFAAKMKRTVYFGRDESRDELQRLS